MHIGCIVYNTLNLKKCQLITFVIKKIFFKCINRKCGVCILNAALKINNSLLIKQKKMDGQSIDSLIST